MDTEMLLKLLKDMEQKSKTKDKKEFKRPKKDYFSTLFNFKMMSEQIRNSKSKAANNLQISATSMNIKRYSSLAEFKDLKPILLKDMIVNKVHRGFYLECVTLVEPFYINSLCTLIKDASGDIENISFYNLDPNYTFDTDILPAETCLIIKEPYLKQTEHGDDEFGLRVDSPTDVIILGADSSYINESVTSLIEKANKLFNNGKFHSAITLYSAAIKMSSEKSARAFLNRAAAHMKLEQYYQCYLDAHKSAQIEDKNEKCYFRMAKAAYLMRQYEKALNNYESCLKINPEQKEALEEIVKCKLRINESKTGVYDFEFLVNEAIKKNNDVCFDVADYVSPLLEIANIKNKSRGVKAVDFIKKGTLLVASKAITVHKNLKNQSHLAIELDFTNKYLGQNSSVKNLSKLIGKMVSDPELAKKVYDLFPGPEYNDNNNNKQKINEKLIDVSRIFGIQKYNSFSMYNSFGNVEDNMEDISSSGVWLFPSYFNHACISNANQVFLGDIMLVYASNDIKKDEELTLSYFSYTMNYAEREKRMQAYNFKCDCQMCVLDRTDSNLRKRTALYEKLSSKDDMMINSRPIAEIKSDLNRLRELYAKRTDLQVDLIIPLKRLAVKYETNFEIAKAIEVYQEILKVLISAKDVALIIFVLKKLSLIYRSCMKKDKEEECCTTASQFYDGNKPYFEALWNKEFN